MNDSILPQYYLKIQRWIFTKRVTFVTASVLLLYMTAYFMPCVHRATTHYSSGAHFGIVIFLAGILHVNYWLPWSGNIFLAAGFLCLWARWFRMALAMGAVASALGLSIWAVLIPGDTLLIGYFVWQASLLVFTMGSLYAMGEPARQTQRRFPVPKKLVPKKLPDLAKSLQKAA